MNKSKLDTSDLDSIVITCCGFMLDLHIPFTNSHAGVNNADQVRHNAPVMRCVPCCSTVSMGS